MQLGDFGWSRPVPVFASDLWAVRQSLHGPLRAAVRVALISSGCVSHHSGPFTGLSAVLGSGPSLWLSWEATALGCPGQSKAVPSHGPTASAVLPGDALRSKKKAGVWVWPIVTLDPASQGRPEAAAAAQ